MASMDEYDFRRFFSAWTRRIGLTTNFIWSFISAFNPSTWWWPHLGVGGGDLMSRLEHFGATAFSGVFRGRCIEDMEYTAFID